MSKATPSVLTDDVEPFSLYLELAQGRLLNIDEAAQIALALSAAVREAAYIIDPSIDIRIELISGTEGSFSFNTFIKSVNTKDLLSKKNLKSLAYICVLWFVTHSADYAFDKTADIVTDIVEAHIQNTSNAPSLSDHEKAEIAEEVAALLKKDIASDKVKAIYRTINSVTSISAVGASAYHAKKPINLVPRSEFLLRSGDQDSELLLPIHSRTTEKDTVVTLVSPVLLGGSHRQWRFATPDGNFGAYMKDEDFLSQLLHGQVKIPMMANIQMDVVLQTKEYLTEGVWEIKERHIVKVKDVSQPPSEPQLDFGKPL